MARVQTRPMTAAERRYVEKELADEESRIPTAGNAGRAFLKNLKRFALGIGAIIAVVIGIGFEIGVDLESVPTLSLAMLFLALAVLVGGAVLMTVFWFRSDLTAYDAEDAEDARRALADGMVVEETHEIVAAKQVVMEDEDGLTYFLLTRENRIFYWVDEESEDLWCDDKSIFDSKARPMSRLIITTTSVGEIEFDLRFEGAPVEIKTGLRFRKDGDDDLIDDDFVDAMPWEDIERRFAR